MFELLDIVPDDYLIFVWNGEIITDYYYDKNLKFVPLRMITLDDQHLYTRSFHQFWIENVNKSFVNEQ